MNAIHTDRLEEIQKPSASLNCDTARRGSAPWSPGEVPSRLQQRSPAGGTDPAPPQKPSIRCWQRQSSPLSE